MLYSFSSIAITATLFALILAANEIGYRVGNYVQNKTDEEVKSLTGAIQASVLGLLALLLGFTFSMSMQRYDNRSLALIDEANAIGTTILRSELLPAEFQTDARKLLQEYVALRISVGQIDLTQQQTRQAYQTDVAQKQSQLWALAVSAAQVDSRPVTSGSFITTLNEMIDAQGKRNALLEMHVPDIVLFLLFTVFIASGGMLGYSSGLSRKRVMGPTIMMTLLIALVVFIIIDLDRPRRGLIQVNQSSMLMLQDATESKP